jgi:hypothetical protein
MLLFAFISLLLEYTKSQVALSRRPRLVDSAADVKIRRRLFKKDKKKGD